MQHRHDLQEESLPLQSAKPQSEPEFSEERDDTSRGYSVQLQPPQTKVSPAALSLSPLSPPLNISLCFSSKVWREVNSTSSRLPPPSQPEDVLVADKPTSPPSPNSPTPPDQPDVNYLALSDTDTADCYTVPIPVYPSSTLPLPGHKKRREREQLTRHQIIDLYCSSDRER